MRLIDADKLESYGTTVPKECNAEDYLCGARDVLESIDSLPTVDAIPIEWIKNRIDHINGIIDERGGMLIAYKEVARGTAKSMIDKAMLNELWVLESMLTIWKEREEE